MTTTHQMNILLVAEEAAGVHALRLISNSGHNLVGVLTTVNAHDVDEHDSDENGGSKKKPLNSSVASIAGNLGIPVLDAKRVQDPGFAAWMNEHHVDVLLNVHSLYRICPEVVQAARVGSFNLHPGPLPHYSGLNVPSWAVYNQEPTHAVTLHLITGKIDSGHIVYETEFPLTPKDTGLTVSLTCAKKGLELIKKLCDDLSRNPFAIPTRPQDLSRRKVYKRGTIPGNGFIRWSESAQKIDAFVRACNYSPFPSPWGEPKTIVGSTEISILKTGLSNKACHEVPGTIGQMVDGKTAVATADNWILVERCKVEGELVDAASFLKYGDKLTSVM